LSGRISLGRMVKTAVRSKGQKLLNKGRDRIIKIHLNGKKDTIQYIW
jgi:hypothetical protein